MRDVPSGLLRSVVESLAEESYEPGPQPLPALKGELHRSEAWGLVGGKFEEEVVRFDGDDDLGLVDLKGGPFAEVVDA